MFVLLNGCDVIEKLISWGKKMILRQKGQVIGLQTSQQTFNR